MTELKQYLIYGNVTPNLSMLDSTIRNEINKIIVTIQNHPYSKMKLG